MKKLIIVLLVAFSMSLSAQKIKTVKFESLLTQVDSNQIRLYKIFTENSEKIPARFVFGNQNCPMFMDEQGFVYFVYVDKQKTIKSRDVDLNKPTIR
jgi:NMD protein affecting ribosome stability and mRNA decay